jgi:hypothetical protein
MRRSQLPSAADPRKAQDRENLRQNKIGERQLFPEFRAVEFDLKFASEKLGIFGGVGPVHPAIIGDGNRRRYCYDAREMPPTLAVNAEAAGLFHAAGVSGNCAAVNPAGTETL